MSIHVGARGVKQPRSSTLRVEQPHALLDVSGYATRIWERARVNAMLPRPCFRPFNPLGGMRIYIRNLPHWRQPGSTYFVTIRQADSIPAGVLAEWLDRRQRWYRAHGLDAHWRETEPERFLAAYRLIPDGVRRAFERREARMLHEELDRCHGSCILRYTEPRRIVTDALQYFHTKRLWIGDFVVMPNHVHALLIPFGGDEAVLEAADADHARLGESSYRPQLSESRPFSEPWKLEDLLGSVKKWTARLIGQWLRNQPPDLRSQQLSQREPAFWQHESYDRIVRDAAELAAFRRYIARNPATAKLRPDEFSYDVASWLDEFAERPTIDVVVS